MNMNPQLEDRIRTAFDELADSTTFDPTARFGDRAAQVVELRTERRHWALPAVAAVAGLALVGGLIAIGRETPEPATTAEQPLPETQPVVTLATPLYDGVPAMFPAADSIVVFSTPAEVVAAYLASRTADDVLPLDLTAAPPGDLNPTGPTLPITYSIGAGGETVVDPGDPNAAVVNFSMQTTVDSGDGLALVHQVAPVGETERWVVTAAGVASFGIDDVTFEAGRLT